MDLQTQNQHHYIFNTDLCMQILKLLLLKQTPKGSNIVFSPVSINTILSLIAAGSTGQTLEQLLFFLRSNTISDLNSLSSQLLQLFTTKETNNDEEDYIRDREGPHLSFVNGVWVDRRLSLKPSFRDTAIGIYRAEAAQVDFQTKAADVTKEVNSWVEHATNGLIKEILPKGSLGSNTALVLANALYFKGTWNRRFNVSATRDREFHLLNGDVVKVPFMASYPSEQYHYRVCDGFTVLKLPYLSGQDDERQFSMYFYLPYERDGLPNLIEKLNDNPNFLNQPLQLGKGDFQDFGIPRFKISYGFEASDTLKDLGLVLPFEEDGELSEMVDSEQGCKICVSDIFHRSLIEVSEEGTEAAASTAALVMSLCLPPKFVADHPFMFMVREEVTGATLFIGAVLNPLLEA
ncbi:serpin-ZX-like [Macadamia integrifolia]|uniref:serpin-ZX-like n=1 Tax=Macadamia integrifolia TaxID=60698 RepID=UPI001C50105A|nr:serpin-ZX-like [Macadamia integrifolia]